MPPATFFRETSGGTLLSVKLQPRASKNEIGEPLGNELKIKVTAPPVDSAANEALVEMLAEKLDCVRIIHYEDRSALAILIVRPHSSTSERAFVVVTYFGGGEVWDRKITLQWFRKSNKWSLLQGSGPADDKIDARRHRN